ncbi:hypothetical protein [Sandarakinorhabdus sp. DWP1-3-1]|uniref:hypothetical protein n=1 Tax=Sandarakinorhabdus sp. DWP1-3-1 TaxID=2804627 RepID=UPI003CF4AF48
MSEPTWRAAAAVAGAAGTQLARARATALAAEIAAVFPEIAAIAADDRVELRAPALRARLFGTRRQPPDLRLAIMVTEGSRR